MKGCKEKAIFFPQHSIVSTWSEHIQALDIYFARGRRAVSYPFLFEVAKL